MAIKKQGGIFGRNPTFKNVDVEDNLTVGDSTLPSVDKIAVLDTTQVFTEKQTLSKAGATFDIFNFEYPTAGDRITMGLDGYNSIMKLFASNGAQSIQLSAGGANSSFFKGVNVELHNSNLVMATAGSGIDFSATSGTGTSELFDDYERGSFEPSAAGTLTAGSGTYNSRSGLYVKVGQMVYAEGWVDMTGHSGSGNLKITGLPYASASLSTAIRPVPFYVTSLTVTSGAYVIGRIDNSSTEILLYEVLAGHASAIPLDTTFVAAFSATYCAA